MVIMKIVVIGFIAGLIARWLAAGEKKPTGFILTTILGIAGAVVATYLGQAIGWYRAARCSGHCRVSPEPCQFREGEESDRPTAIRCSKRNLVTQ